MPPLSFRLPATSAACCPAGYALVYLLPPNRTHEAALLAAERDAREARRGLWAQVLPHAIKVRCIEFNAPGDDNLNKNGEWVEIENTGTSPVNLKGWSLRDEGNPRYVFGDLGLGPGAVILDPQQGRAYHHRHGFEDSYPSSLCAMPPYQAKGTPTATSVLEAP